jgi:hypothetical protein
MAVVAHLGCMKCGALLYDVEAVETAGPDPSKHTGVFEHKLKARAGAEPKDHLRCACGGELERVMVRSHGGESG